MADSLILSGFGELMTDAAGARAYLMSGFDMGSPEPVTTALANLVMDGSTIAGERLDNRVVTLPLRIPGNTSRARAALLNQLFTVINSPQFLLTWTPDGGLPVIFDCQRGQVVIAHDLLAAKQGDLYVTAIFPAAPTTRGPSISITPGSSGTLLVDALDATTGHAVQSGGTLATTTNYMQGTAALKDTFTQPAGFAGIGVPAVVATLDGTISSTNLTNYTWLQVNTFARWSPSLPPGGSPGELVLRLQSSSGNYKDFYVYDPTQVTSAPWRSEVPTTAYTPMVAMIQPGSDTTHVAGSAGTLNLGAVTYWRLTWTTGRTDSGIGHGPFTVDWYADEVKALPASPGGTTSADGTIVWSGITGAARTPMQLDLAPVNGAQNVAGPMVVHRRGNPPAGYTPLVSLATSTKVAAFRGTFLAVAKVHPTSFGTPAGTVTVTLTFTVDGSSYSKAISRVMSGTDISASWPSHFLAPIDFVTLPPEDVPTVNSTSTFQVTGSISFSNGAGSLEAVYLIYVGEDAETLLLGADGDYKGTSAAGDKLLIDPPSGQQLTSRVSTGTDRAAAISAMRGVRGTGVMRLDPGTNLLAIINGPAAGVNATVTYSPRHVLERDA